MERDKSQLLAQIRYSIKLGEITSRFYSRAHAFFVWLNIFSASSAMYAFYDNWNPYAKGFLLLLFSALFAVNHAVKPLEKSTLHNYNAKKYKDLYEKALSMDEDDIRKQIASAEKTDVQEIESLRSVAYNYLMEEINRTDSLITLTPLQKLFKAIS